MLILWSGDFVDLIKIVDIEEDLDTAVRTLQEATQDAQATVSWLELLILRRIKGSNEIYFWYVYSSLIRASV